MKIKKEKFYLPLIIGLILNIVAISSVHADSGRPSAEMEKLHKDIDDHEFEFKGSLKDGRPHGSGIGAYRNGDKYEGGYKDGKKHGQGVYSWANGDKYEGEFSDGMEHGEGTYTWADGNKYVGKFKENNPIGGWIHWPDGGKAWSYKDSKGNWVYK